VGQSYNIQNQQVQTKTYVDPVTAYDRIAPVFSRLAEQRKPYLDRIDQLVLSELPPESRSLLDVGSGDGTRARRIAQTRGISELVLLEPSRAMQGNHLVNAKVWTMRAEELHSVQAQFDVITCLWNVLGHIFPASARIGVLRQFARLVSPQGRIFVDVNHRYNARHYGSLQTALRFLRDRVFWNETNGDVTVAWGVEHTKCTTRGHVFTDKEFRALARAAGLGIENTFIVDYVTGDQRRWSWQGNPLYVLRPSQAHRAGIGKPR
jgi:2-polyprenyl-3-methyl-5-hydroxy-6-metoxy-1,4-benzoquinol methylase